LHIVIRIAMAVYSALASHAASLGAAAAAVREPEPVQVMGLLAQVERTSMVAKGKGEAKQSRTVEPQEPVQ
jgi:hypothetical protein